MDPLIICLISAVVAFILQICNKKMKNEEVDNMELSKLSVLVAVIVFVAITYHKSGNKETILTESFEN